MSNNQLPAAAQKPEHNFKKGDFVTNGKSIIIVIGRQGNDKTLFAGVIVQQNDSTDKVHHIGDYSESWHGWKFKKIDNQPVAPIGINFDRIEANQAAGMPYEDAVFQDGYSAGVEFQKSRSQSGPVWVKASERLPVKDGYYCFKANGGYMGAYLRTASNGSRWFCDSAGGTIRSWKQCEWLDESPAEQPVADNELKQEVDHLEKKISMCEDALEKLHAERYETRLALGRLLKVFKSDQKSKGQEKYYSQAEYILNKHSKSTDALRTGTPEQPAREVDIKIIDFIRDVAKNWDCDEDGHTHNTGCRKCDASELLYDLTRQQKPGSGGKEVDAEAFAKYLDEQRSGHTPDMWAEKAIWDKPDAFQEWLKYFKEQREVKS